MRDAVITITAVVLSFVALDDITTDIATTGFIPERIALLVCSGWFVFVALRILRTGQRFVGTSSVVVALALAVAEQAIGPGKGGPIGAALVVLIGFGWFTAIAGRLTCSRPAF